MTLDNLDYLNQLFSYYVNHKNLDPIFSKFKIGQWHLIAFFSQKMILTKTQYKTHNEKLLAINKAFMTWHHYLESCKYKIIIFTTHNNLCQFMDMKSLSFCQVCRAQELFKYYFQFDYYQRKANAAADTLSRFL